jgi:hypothetical protein
MLWPGRWEIITLLSWQTPVEGDRQMLFEWFFLEESKRRIRGERVIVPLGVSLPGGTADLAFWLEQLRSHIAGRLQKIADNAWQKRRFPGLPEPIRMEEADVRDLVRLRLAGRGEAGLTALASHAPDLEVRELASSLLGLAPLAPEELKDLGNA